MGQHWHLTLENERTRNIKHLKCHSYHIGNGLKQNSNKFFQQDYQKITDKVWITPGTEVTYSLE
jgi:hypothetical protein